MKQFIRVYQEYDVNEVKRQLLIVGDLSADCGACRELGLDLSDAVCKGCGTAFKYVSSRRAESHQGERFKLVKRIKDKRPDLIFIDYGDYDKLMGQQKARDLFGG